MSRAFVKDDAGSEEIRVPERAPLPDGAPNLVTERGLAELERERDALLAERSALHDDASPAGRDVARRLAVVGAALTAVEDRLRSARLVRDADVAPDEVGFGSTVTLRTLDGEHAGEVTTFRIVGVDEADPFEGRVAFTAPTVRAVLGLRPGERAAFAAGAGERTVEVVAVDVP